MYALFDKSIRSLLAFVLAVAFVPVVVFGHPAEAYASLSISRTTSFNSLTKGSTLCIDTASIGISLGGDNVSSVSYSLTGGSGVSLAQSGKSATLTFTAGASCSIAGATVTAAYVLGDEVGTAGTVSASVASLLGTTLSRVFADVDEPTLTMSFTPDSGYTSNGVSASNGPGRLVVQVFDSCFKYGDFQAIPGQITLELLCNGAVVNTQTKLFYQGDASYTKTAEGVAGGYVTVNAYSAATFNTFNLARIVLGDGKMYAIRATVTITDLGGRARTLTQTFTFDTNPPTIDGGLVGFSGSQHGQYYVVAGNNVPLATYTATDDSGHATFTVSGADGHSTVSGNTVTLFADATPFRLGDVTLNAKDAAGNASPTISVSSALDGRGPLFVADGDTPAVSLTDATGAPVGKFVKTTSVTLTVSDDSFGYLASEYDNTDIATFASGSKTTTLRGKDFRKSGTVWTAILDCSADGDYSLKVSFKDVAGHQASYNAAFSIDTKGPSVNLVSYPGQENDTLTGLFTEDSLNGAGEEGIIANHVIISVKDDHFDPTSGGYLIINGKRYDASWTKSGNVWYGAVDITEEGTFTVESATATDLAGNTTTVKLDVTFTIEDNRRPVIRFVGVEDQAAISGEVVPGVRITDTNLDTSKTKISLVSLTTGKEVSYTYTGSASAALVTRMYEAFPMDLEVDGIYRFSVYAEDEKGNATSRTILFSVNRYGSTYLFDDETEALRGAYLQRAGKVSFIEINPSGFKAGAISIVVTVDGVPHVLVEGKDFLLEPVADSAWPALRYTFITDPFTTDSYYQIVARSVDRANNLNQNIMWTRGFDHAHAAELTFALDTTAPSAQAMERDLCTCFYGASRTVTLLLQDNMELASVTATLDGEELVLPELQLGSAATLTVEIPAAEALRTLEVTVTDAAGNTSTAVIEGIFVTDSWGTYWVNTPRLQALTIIGVAALVLVLAAGVVFLVWRGKRKREARADFD